MNARRASLALATALALTACSARPRTASPWRSRIRTARAPTPLDGRLLLLLSTNPEGEPRTQVTYGVGAQPIFGVDVDGWEAGATATFTDTVFGFPVDRLGDLPRGRTGRRRS